MNMNMNINININININMNQNLNDCQRLFLFVVYDVFVGTDLMPYFCYFYIYSNLLSIAVLKNRNSYGFADVFFYHSDPLNLLLNFMIFSKNCSPKS